MTNEPGIALVDTVDGTVLHEHAHRARSDLGRLLTRRRAGGHRHRHRRGRRARRRPPAIGSARRRSAITTRSITVAYAPDGDTLVSGGLDGRVALWDGNTGALLGSVVASPNVATAAGFAPDGHTVVIASTDGTVARWDTQVEQWISASCKIAGRSLTPAEWADILADRPYIDTCS